MTPREDLLQRAVMWFAHNGIGDTSMRTLAAELGTSGRMLNYHFGSRAALLAAVVTAVEHNERAVLAELLDTTPDPYDAGAAFWTHVADTAQTFAPLYFELSAHAMHGMDHALRLRDWLASGWLDVLARGFRKSGLTPARARSMARISLATARGLLFELAVTGDRPAADRAMRDFTEMVRAAR